MSNATTSDPTADWLKSASDIKADRDCWQQVLDAGMLERKRVLLWGPPGTGKSYITIEMAKTRRKPLVSITCYPNQDPTEMRGHFVQGVLEVYDAEGHLTHATSRFTWMDGPVVQAMDNGWILAINEIGRLDGPGQSFLLQVTDSAASAVITLPTTKELRPGGKTIRPAEGFEVWANSNDDPGDLEHALADRFPVQIYIDKINPNALLALPEDLREPCKQTAMISDPSRRKSVRKWMDFAEARAKGMEKGLSLEAASAVAARFEFGAEWKDVLNGLKLASTATAK